LRKEAQECLQRGDFGRAKESLRRLLQADKKDLDSLYMLAQVTRYRQEYEESAVCIDKLLKWAPNFMAYNEKGNLLNAQCRYAEAELAFREALALNPKSAQVLNNLGISLAHQDLLEPAVAAFRQATRLAPEMFATHSAALFHLTHIQNLDPDLYLRDALVFGKAAQQHAKVFTNWSRQPGGEEPPCLKVGFVSADLFNHPVGYFLESLFRRLDKKRFEIHVYSNRDVEDSMALRLKAEVKQWRPIANLSDGVVAAQIRADGVDILFDLSGHSTLNRLPVFAWKPAPIQVSWLGYFASTGLRAMDYYLADPYSVTPEIREQFVEQLWLLPETRLCFSPPESAPPVNAGPALQSGHVRFGCLQRGNKVQDATLRLWAEILRRVPDSRLFFQHKGLEDESYKWHFKQRLSACGLPVERVDFAGPASRESYLAAYHHIDMVLDTLPFTGGTTTCEALWMGVPTLTRVAPTLIGRQGLLIMHHVGLDDWVCNSDEEYVAAAVRIAGQPARLSALRQALRARLQASPLMDAEGFATDFGNALRGMWRHARTGG